MSLLPKTAAGVSVPYVPFIDKPSSSSINYTSSPPPKQPQNNIPPEYQNDPDLWFAIQASLGNENPSGPRDEPMDMYN